MNKNNKMKLDQFNLSMNHFMRMMCLTFGRLFQLYIEMVFIR